MRRATPAASTAISASSLGLRHFGDRGVGDQHGAPARQHQRQADHAMAGLGIDDAAHVLQRHGKVARDAGDHGVGVAERHHAGGEVVAVLVDQALAVAEQVALALQALVEIGGVVGVALRQRGVDDLDALAELDAEVLRALRGSAPRGRPAARCRGPRARSSRRRGSPAPPRPRRTPRAWATAAAAGTPAAARRRPDRAASAATAR